MASTDHPVILFDGVCNLCNASVNFVIDRDPDHRFRFAALQSEAGEKLLQQFDLPDGYLDSLVLVENDQVYVESSAALRIAKGLTFPWKLAYVFVIIPRFIRDPIYRWIARNRYRWFGKKETCRIPTPELKSLFLS